MSAFRFSRSVTWGIIVTIALALVPILPQVGAAGGGMITYGDVVNGQITAKNYFELWEFTGNKGDHIQVTMEGDGNLDPYLGLLSDTTEEVLAEDDDSAGNSNAFIEMTLSESGSFTIVATRYDLEDGTSQGAYNLQLVGSSSQQNAVYQNTNSSVTEPVEIEPGLYYMGDLVLSEVVTSTIVDTAYAHFYTIDAQPGDELLIAMVANESSQLDSYLIFSTSEGDIVAEDDDSGSQLESGGKFDSLIQVTVKQADTYHIIATRPGFESGTSSGDYSLIALIPGASPSNESAPVQPEPAGATPLPDGMAAMGAIALGQTARGSLTTSTYIHLYVLSGQAGEQLTITLRGPGGLDTYLGLLDPNDEVIAEDDDSGGGTDAQIAIRLPESGDYLIIATRSGLEDGTTTGDYTLEVTSGQPAIPEPTAETTTFGGLPGRAIQTDSRATLYLRGFGASNNPEKNTALENFSQQNTLPGRDNVWDAVRPQFSLNFEEIK